MSFEVFKAPFHQMGWVEKQMAGHLHCHALDASRLLRLCFLLNSRHLSPSPSSLGVADCIKVVSATLAQHLHAASCVVSVISQICLFSPVFYGGNKPEGGHDDQVKQFFFLFVFFFLEASRGVEEESVKHICLLKKERSALCICHVSGCSLMRSIQWCL